MTTPGPVRVAFWQARVFRRFWVSNLLASFVQPLLYLLGLGVGGALTTATVAGADKGPAKAPDFSNLKHVKAPSPCQNDPGVSDDTIKVGTLLPESGPSAVSSLKTARPSAGRAVT